MNSVLSRANGKASSPFLLNAEDRDTETSKYKCNTLMRNWNIIWIRVLNCVSSLCQQSNFCQLVLRCVRTILSLARKFNRSIDELPDGQSLESTLKWAWRVCCIVKLRWLEQTYFKSLCVIVLTICVLQSHKTRQFTLPAARCDVYLSPYIFSIISTSLTLLFCEKYVYMYIFRVTVYSPVSKPVYCNNM